MKEFPRSPNGKYVFPICSISGVKSFANQEYFAKTLAKKFGGSEARMIKEYVSREAKKYLAEGFTKEQIRELVERHKGKLPKIAPKISKEKIPKKPRKQRLKAVTTETVVEMVNGVAEEVVKKTYPWTNNPSYFGDGTRGTIDMSKETDTCHRSDYYLDSMCHGCPLYDICVFERKYGPNDYLDKKKNKRTTEATVVKKLNPFDGEVELAVVAS
jgi:hypothetical protein